MDLRSTNTIPKDADAFWLLGKVPKGFKKMHLFEGLGRKSFSSGCMDFFGLL